MSSGKEEQRWGGEGTQCPVLSPWDGAGLVQGPDPEREKHRVRGVRQLPREECSAGETREGDPRRCRCLGTSLVPGVCAFICGLSFCGLFKCKAALSWALMPRPAPFMLLHGGRSVAVSPQQAPGADAASPQQAPGADGAAASPSDLVDLLHLPGVSGHPAAALHDQQDRGGGDHHHPLPVLPGPLPSPVPRQLDLALLLRGLLRPHRRGGRRRPDHPVLRLLLPVHHERCARPCAARFPLQGSRGRRASDLALAQKANWLQSTSQ